jgi:hypothetical protein
MIVRLITHAVVAWVVHPSVEDENKTPYEASGEAV